MGGAGEHQQLERDRDVVRHHDNRRNLLLALGMRVQGAGLRVQG